MDRRQQGRFSVLNRALPGDQIGTLARQRNNEYGLHTGRIRIPSRLNTAAGRKARPSQTQRYSDRRPSGLCHEIGMAVYFLPG